MIQAKCKISRRLGVNVFPKCGKVVARRPYPPGPKKKRRTAQLSEYGKEMREKQKLRYLYNLREKQFGNYVRNILTRRGGSEDAAVALIQARERRLDNAVFRLGFAATRQQARQMVSHGHFLVNQKRTTVPSYQIKKGDEVALRLQSRQKTLFKELGPRLKSYQSPVWLELDAEKLTGKIVGDPSLEEAAPPVEMSSIFEFYSR